MPASRILVVDDSVVARRVISDILSAEEDFEVVGTAPNGRIALAKIPRLRPDLVTLDIDMPELDGLETLAVIRSDFPEIRVIMVSNLTLRGAAVTVESLFLGASDYVTKATRSSSPEDARRYLRSQLVPKTRALVQGDPSHLRRAKRQAPRSSAPRARSQAAIEGVVIGASTGGPNALATVIRALPADFPAPVLIVQHMPENFTTFLAQRLDAAGPLDVREAASGEPVTPGIIRIAPGNLHLMARTTRSGIELETGDGPLENSCRPAADVLFRSAATCFGAATLAVVLTGMGQDGLKGCREIRSADGRIIAQDKASSVVWGMPGQVVNAGLADFVLPISEIGPEIVRRVKASRS
ncbi:MAG: chemotaxis response regulator protein-glutamate methylesterase [Thermoanaerobaculales bacterium]